MKFLTEKKKLFALIAMICLALTLVYNVIAACAGAISSLGSMFYNFRSFLVNFVSLITIGIGLLTVLCYVAGAFLVWKKDDHMKILGLGGVISIIALFMGLVSYLVSSITYDYFTFGIFLTTILDCFLPCLFAAYLIVFSLIKMKGPVVPIIGAVLVVLLCGSSIIGVFSQTISNIIHLFDYFSWGIVWNTIVMIFHNFINLIQNVGLLLLVPVAFYIPKEEEVVVAEVIEEAVIEETPAAE